VAERAGLRVIRAANPAPLTLDGTRTYIVGRERVALIDPGPDLQQHIDAVAEAIGGGVVVCILLTHDHPDHADGAAALARRVNAPILRHGAGLAHGQRVQTDAGDLVAIATPGHTPDHIAFHWPDARVVFVGDLMLGGMDTALVAPPEGDLAAYLDSLERVRALGATTLYPAHGEPFDDPPAAIARYIAHRKQRLERVREALEAARPLAVSAPRITRAVYGPDLDETLRPAAEAATLAYLRWLERTGAAHTDEKGRWRA
jgi:glyoxylase-like metal-dependent hydrolase (beta-lactamase superfamily II)